MNGDGLADVIVHMQHGQPGVYIYFAPEKAGDEWERVTALNVKRSKGGRSSIHAAVSPQGYGDIDGDGDVYEDEMEHLHVPGGREGKVGMTVWENIDGKGGAWRQHAVVKGLGGHQVQIADLDGDGDMDIVTRPYKPQGNANGGRMHVSVLENLARNPDATGSGSGIGPGSTGSVLAVKTESGLVRKPTVSAKSVKAVSEADLAKGLVAGWSFDDLPGGVLAAKYFNDAK